MMDDRDHGDHGNRRQIYHAHRRPNSFRGPQETQTEVARKSLAQQIIGESRGEKMLQVCDNDQTYRNTLHILIKCLCNEENRTLQGGIIEILCILILQRCNVKTKEDSKTEDLVAKGKELLYKASNILDTMLRRRISKQRGIIFAFMDFASQHPSKDDGENKNVRGLYIPAMILARNLYYLKSHEVDEEVVWERKFYGMFGRLVFAMGFRGEAVYANKKELELCSPILDTLSQKSFDTGIVPVISFKMMEESEAAIHALATFSSFLYSYESGHLLEIHLDDGLNLVFTSLNMLRHGKDIDVHNSAIKVLVALAKSCSCAALVMISQTLIVELSYRGSESVNYRMLLYHAFEEIAMVTSFQNRTDYSLLKAHFHSVTDALNASLELESSMVEENAAIGCEAALEAWMALKGDGNAYQPRINKWYTQGSERIYPSEEDTNKRADVKPSASTHKNTLRSESNRSLRKLECQPTDFESRPNSLRSFMQKSRSIISDVTGQQRVRPESSRSLRKLESECFEDRSTSLRSFMQRSSSMLSYSKYMEDMNDFNEPRQKRCGLSIKLWRKRPKN